jgi:hypothetical protein
MSPEESRKIDGGLNIDNLGIWLARVRIDPNFDKNVVKDWIRNLETYIKRGEVKLEFAKLCARLYTDWLESGDAVTVRSDVSGPLPREASESDVPPGGREEMYEQLARLRSIIFEPTDIDTDALEVYLTELFSSKAASTVWEEMRAGMFAFGKSLQDWTITAEEMRWTVESLLASDLMLPDKRAALREFTDNDTVLEEVANVVNMRLRALGSWKWAEPITVDMRRYLNGKYRAFTDPDILDALFLQWVGVMWGMKFKQDARDIFSSAAWKVGMGGDGSVNIPSNAISCTTPYGANRTINGERKSHRLSLFLAGHLPDNVLPVPNYDDPVDTAKDDLRDSTGATVEVKQQLLNIMSTECQFNLSLYESHTIVRTDMDWFGPSLPHESILTLLRFFGVPPDWLGFFRVFLGMPIRFPGETEARTRVRGTPISYALSGFFGEVILFGLDFAVNQHADGLFLYRIHDDIYFWDPNTSRCARGWKTMNTYADLVGLSFNMSKTGSVCVGGDSQLASELPTGDIRWGFLKFDTKEARFVIDQAQVNEHINELRRQLGKTKSIMGWISVYNKYMAFFVRNFGGRPAECLGRTHIVDMSRTLVRIQQEVIGGADGGADDGADDGRRGAIEHLENELANRYGVHDLPKGYFYFPLSVGGLAVRDPLIDIIVMGESMTVDAVAPIKAALSNEVETYEVVKRQWETKQRQEATVQSPPPVFIPFSAYCEMESYNIHQIYASLVTVNKPRFTQVSLVNSLLYARGRWEFFSTGTESYNGWVLDAYGKEVINKFGGLEIVDPRMIPIGLVHLYKTSRIKWDQ